MEKILVCIILGVTHWQIRLIHFLSLLKTIFSTVHVICSKYILKGGNITDANYNVLEASLENLQKCGMQKIYHAHRKCMVYAQPCIEPKKKCWLHLRYFRRLAQAKMESISHSSDIHMLLEHSHKLSKRNLNKFGELYQKKIRVKIQKQEADQESLK